MNRRNPTKVAAEIASARAQLETLEAEWKALNSLTPLERLATMLHDSTCTWNHTDGCGWWYESWNGATPAGNSTRSGYLLKASILVNKSGLQPETIAKVLEIWQEIK